MALRVAAKDELPSSASVTWHVAEGTDPLLYEAAGSTPATTTTGPVFDGGAADTLTVNVAGSRVKVPLVSFDTSLTLIVAVPSPTGEMVNVFGSLQDLNVTDEGLTVATEALFDETVRTRLVCPVILQPDFK